MAVVVVAGFVLTSRQELRGLPGAGDAGMMSYMLPIPPLVLLTGSAAAAAVGRSFRSGLRACAWAIVLGAPLLVAAWLAEALHWYQQGSGMLLDGEGGIGVGANLGDAVRWTLPGLLLWALPLDVVGRDRRERARGAAGPASTAISPRRPDPAYSPQIAPAASQVTVAPGVPPLREPNSSPAAPWPIRNQ
jgi:hypothetical protein